MVKKKKSFACVFFPHKIQVGFYNFIKFCFKKSQQRGPESMNLEIIIVKEITQS